MAHVLIVGGTGKLRAVSCFLAEKGNVVTVIARDREKLHDLACTVAAQGGKINPISVDYNNLDKMGKVLQASIRTFGPIQLALTWMKPTSLPSLIELGQLLNRTSPVCRFFHVCNQSWLDLLQTSETVETAFAPLNRVYYRKILIGRFATEPAEQWLTPEEINEEINLQIIQALSDDTRHKVIGRIEPISGQALSA